MATDITDETAIFERIILPSEPALTEPVAKFLLTIGFGSGDRQRMNELAEKARQAVLTPEEERAIESYERVGHYLAILQSTARLAIKRVSNPDA